MIYEDGKPVGISNVVISTQHSADVKHSEIKDFCIEEVIRKVLPTEMLNSTTEFLINPTGTFRCRRSAGRYRPNRPQDHRR